MIEERVFTLNFNNNKLVGIRSIPDKVCEKYKTIILAHGFGVDKSNKGMFDDLTKSLVEAGFMVYRFDFAGCGESEGNYMKISITKLKKDLKRIIQFVKSKEDTDLDNIGLVGNSMGSSVVLALKPHIKSVCFIGGHHDVYSTISSLFGYEFNPDGISSRINSGGDTFKLGPQFWSDLKENHIYLKNNISELKCPTLLVHGENDEHIPFSQAEELYELANEPKRLIKIPLANHNFTEHRKELCFEVSGWFDKYLN